MSFMLSRGWHYRFLEADLKIRLPKALTFIDERKIRELAERSRAFANLEARHALNHGIANGIYLELTDEQ